MSVIGSKGNVLLEKVFDAGANTIWSEMKKLRGKPEDQKDEMRKRWVWELIQNASDCTPENGKVNISVKLRENNLLEFSHDGLPFTYENIIDLVTQISSKQSDENVKTGKFGTGFISTHLLSERVGIKSLLVREDGQYSDLKMIVDRSGQTYHDIRTKIKETLDQIEGIKLDNNVVRQPNSFKTSFLYKANESAETLTAVKVGLEDLHNTVSIVLALNSTIETINCNGELYRVARRYNSQIGNLEIVEFDNPLISHINVLIKRDNDVAIALLAQRINENKFRVLSINKDLPKLFCNFPLVGTESFSFPIVVNCSEFEVEKDRNAIHEGLELNKSRLGIAQKLYIELLKQASEFKWDSIYNLCTLQKNKSTLQTKIYSDIEREFELLPIVETNKAGQYYGRVAIKKQVHRELIKQIKSPFCDKEELSDDFWELVNFLVKDNIPIKNENLYWQKMVNNRITLYDINKGLKDHNVSNLQEYMDCTEGELWGWLNKFYLFWLKCSGVDDLLSIAYVPNQNGDFIKVSSLYRDNRIDEKLVVTLVRLGIDIRATLIDNRIQFGEDITGKFRDNVYVAKKIQEEVNSILSDETINNTQRTVETQQIFNGITDWFLINTKLGNELFDTLYDKRSLLSPPEENLRRLKIAEKIESHNIKYEQLDDIIGNHSRISNILENIDNLSFEDLKGELKHISKNSIYSKEVFNNKLERSIDAVYSYLSDLSDYEIADTLEEWVNSSYSDTVFPAKCKDRDIRVVIRPSDQNKIIFFYEEEREALDDVDYELWTHNGNITKRLTLGDIIKTTGITIIPLRNLYKNN